MQDSMRSTIGRHVLALEQAGTGYSMGYNAATEQWEDLIASGVIDPCKVVLETLRNAIAVAGELICTDAAVMQEGTDARTPE